MGLQRLHTVITNFVNAGFNASLTANSSPSSNVILFIGAPEYYGNGTSSQTQDIVHNSAAWQSFSRMVNATLTVPAVQSHVRFVSVYWMSAYCAARGASFCSEADITTFNTALQALVRANSPPASSFAYLQHVDGPFWEGCWPQPCNATAWKVGGYTPKSLQGADALLGESWVQGSLKGAVATLWTATNNTFGTSNTLLLNDVPNCDLYPSTKPCSTGSLTNDDSVWFSWLQQMGLNGTWGVWDSFDGGLYDANYYGDCLNNGTGLTAKGALHRQAVLNKK